MPMRHADGAATTAGRDVTEIQSNKLKYAGKTAIITGSGTGIGKAIATEFVKEGANVIILGRRREPLDEAATFLKQVAADGAWIKIFAGVDVSDETGVDSMFATLKEGGIAIDYIINNAGVSGPVTCFPNASMDDFVGTVSIHLSGTFWISAAGLACMKKGGKIITISTFFTEERPLEQRPYRFRSPYTASQGAKNRLAEAMSWELMDRGIVSIATNPGPVHSDRIYKTVYPKAAAEFMRVGGFEDMTPTQVEEANRLLLPLLGEDDSVVKTGISAAVASMSQNGITFDKLERLLKKIQNIAEKIQRNTSHMIADRQFLSQEEVAKTVLNLCDDTMSHIVNGKVIPGDRVFYPVRPHIGTTAPESDPSYKDGCVVISLDPTTMRDSQRAAYLAAHIADRGGKAVLLVPKNMPGDLMAPIVDLHTHAVDFSDGDQVSRWLRTASEKMGNILCVVHMTGALPDTSSLLGLDRAVWDELVSKFINTPARVTQRALEHFVPGGSKDPRKFRGSGGSVMIVGPDLPPNKKLSGADRARVEVFRGALRPFTTTVNQELGDVLKSKARVFAVLPGSVSGIPADDKRAATVLDYMVSGTAWESGEVIFCPDESRA